MVSGYILPSLRAREGVREGGKKRAKDRQKREKERTIRDSLILGL